MAGASFTIDVHGQQAINDALNQLIERGDDMHGIFSDIGELLLQSHTERFERGIAPDGSAWEPLSPDYQKRKKKNADAILRLNDMLSGTLNYDASKDYLEFGTPMVYGAIHQFGGTNDMPANLAAIPARPWLGVSDDDEAEILSMLSDYISSAS